ncbi:MAG: DUF4325 domain-containing protein [Hespellia sp.]|nr:DUF4325 domain-containing protein [Hespellia sp.]
MSFQEEKRESIKRYMLDKIREDDKEYIKKTVENFGISVTTVKRYVKECLDREIICESDVCRCGHALSSEEIEFQYDTKSFLSEDRIFFEDIRPLLKKVSKESLNIWGYAFTEIMNNAIEHSGATQIFCRVKTDALYTEIVITDDGIGIFQKVKEYLQEKEGRETDTQDALTELYKGKFTTNKSSHSGEGIFFTSKVLREFAIWSDENILVSGSYKKEHLVSSHLISYYTKLLHIGTMVVMKLENSTNRSIKEVFDMFAPLEEGFVRTVIPLKEVCPYGEPIARSQARRIVYRLEEFKYVEFDCSGIEFMGQGFADEIFRVFQNKYPNIELSLTNANTTVAGMVQHVKKS